MEIDTKFDFRTDAGGKDPDTYSPTLRHYHRTLWSKALPNGRRLMLDNRIPGAYLHHQSDLGEFVLCSDSIVPTFTRWVSLRHVTGMFPEEESEAFRAIGYSIGGMIVFPGKRMAGKQTINGARGFNRKIADRFDLTLECIRRHYLGEASPLADVLARYHQFFDLFEDFEGYVTFFHLQDLVVRDWTVKFFLPFDDFRTPAVPRDVDEYRGYRERSIQFVEDRNRRIGAAARSPPL